MTLDIFDQAFGTERTMEQYQSVVIDVLSESYKRQIRNELGHFDKFCKAHFKVGADNVIRELLKQPQQTQTKNALMMLQQYANERKLKVMSSTVRIYIMILDGFLHWCGVRVDPRDKRLGLRLPKIIKEERYPLGIDEVRKIFRTVPERRLRLYLALISSGMRIGEALQIRKHDLVLYKNHYFVTLRAETTKTKFQREVVLSQEATKRLQPHVENLGMDDPVFKITPHGTSVIIECITFSRLVDKSGMGERYKNSTGRKITLHRFRGFFSREASMNVTDAYAQKMLGHGGYLPEYNAMNRDQKLQYYAKVEEHVTVFEYDRIEAQHKKEIDQLRQKTDDLENKVAKLLEKERRE